MARKSSGQNINDCMYNIILVLYELLLFTILLFILADFNTLF